MLPWLSNQVLRVCCRDLAISGQPSTSTVQPQLQLQPSTNTVQPQLQPQRVSESSELQPQTVCWFLNYSHSRHPLVCRVLCMLVSELQPQQAPFGMPLTVVCRVPFLSYSRSYSTGMPRTVANAGACPVSRYPAIMGTAVDHDASWSTYGPHISTTTPQYMSSSSASTRPS